MPQLAPILLTVFQLMSLVVGSSAFTVFLVWCLARFTKTFDAYSAERARLFAQEHNLEKLLHQTEQLTRTTESIKAEVTDAQWDNQTKWTFKRDTYVNLFDVLAEISAKFLASELDSSFKMPGTDQTVKQLINGLNFPRMQFLQVETVALVVFSNESLDILKSLKSTIERPDMEQREVVRSSLSEGLRKLTDSARRDLGYEPLP